MTNLHIYQDTQELYSEAAALFTRLANEAIASQGRFTVAFSGGSTPKSVYTLLAHGNPRMQPIAWPYVHVFWGDERCVPPTHQDSNYHMANEALLAHVPIPPENIHRIQAELEPLEAAYNYERKLREVFSLPSDGTPCFDLALLGMGPDGHTASLFPGTSGLQEKTRLAVAHYVEKLSSWRVTLTAKVFNAAAHVAFLVAGADKALTLKEVLEGPFQPDRLPSQLIQPAPESLQWLVEATAASGLTHRPSDT
ncbi:MAG: 6-phosphogluconolactonase [Deltaproteobacteria bacterium]|nr:6-phosphogluconolactonase [Deltaproteobacteria bacterium]